MPGRVDQLRAHVPERLRPAARATYRRAARFATRSGLRRRLQRVRWGSLRRLRPVSARYGFDRGTPIDRVFIDGFFELHADDITGRVLEVRDAGFTERFGRGVTQVDVVDIDPTNDRATIVADLADAGSLPADSFDCAIVAQTLQYVRDLDTTLANLWSSLAPGGVLLVTVPAVAKLDHDLLDIDRWRFNAAGLRTAIEAACPDAHLDVGSRGNVLTAVAFLMGLAAEELRAGELATDDPSFPMLTFARARKPA